MAQAGPARCGLQEYLLALHMFLQHYLFAITTRLINSPGMPEPISWLIFPRYLRGREGESGWGAA